MLEVETARVRRVISEVCQVDDIAHVVSDELNEVIDRLDDRVMLQSIRFEDLITQHAE